MIIPATIPWRLAGAFLLTVCVFAAGWMANGWRKDAVIAQMKTDQANERERQSFAQMKAVDDARAEEQRRAQTLSEIANDATKQADMARADARAAGATAERLRQRVATLLRDASNPAATGAGPTTGTAGVVLSDVFTWADNRAGELAEALDASRIAGAACERAYEALTPTAK